MILRILFFRLFSVLTNYEHGQNYRVTEYSATNFIPIWKSTENLGTWSELSTNRRLSHKFHNNLKIYDVNVIYLRSETQILSPLHCRGSDLSESSHAYTSKSEVLETRISRTSKIYQTWKYVHILPCRITKISRTSTSMKITCSV